MKRSPALILILLCSLALVACAPGARFTATSGWSGPVAGDDLVYVGSRAGRVLALEASSGRRHSVFPPMPQEPLAGLYGTPALADGRLFVGGYDGRLYALNARIVETEDWRFPTDDNQLGPIVGGIAVSEGTVVFGSSDGNVYALDTNGNWKWTFRTENMVWSTPTIVDGIVYIGSLDHRMYAIFLQDGLPRWTKPFQAGGAITSSPVVTAGKVFFGSFDHKFYALDADSVVQMEVYEGDSWFWSNPVTDGKRIYAASMSGVLFSLDLARGGVWREVYDLGDHIISTPVLIDGSVIVTSDGGIVYTLDPETGQPESPPYNVGAEVRAPLGGTTDTVYVNAMDEQVWAIRVGGRQQELWHTGTADEN